MISLRLYYKGKNILLAACDSELLGKKFSNSKFQLEISEFYHDTIVDEKTFLAHLEHANIVNLVGEKVVSLAIKAGYVDKKNIILISKVPHAQVVKIIK